MTNTDFQSVDDYIGLQPEGAQAVLQSVRAALRKALPRAEEVIKCQKPAFELDGRIVIFLASAKEHYYLWPVTDKAKSAFRNELEHYDIGPCIVRFPLSEPIPAALIEKIAMFRANELAERWRHHRRRLKAAASEKKR